MFWDIAVAVTLTLLTTGVGYMGFHVTIKPPQDQNKKWWITAFASIAALIGILVITQTVRNHYQQAETGRSISGLNNSLNNANEQLAETNAALSQSSIQEAYMQGQLSGLSLMVGKINTTDNANSQTIAGALKVIANGASGGVRPPAIQRMTNKQLREAVIEYAGALRKACSEYMNQEETQSNNNSQQDWIHLSAQERQKFFQDKTNREIAKMNTFNLRLQQEFGADSIVYRDELLRRLGPQSPSATGGTWFSGNGTIIPGYWKALRTADFLEVLTKQLPK